MCTNAIAIFNSKHVKGAVKFHQCGDSDQTNIYFDLSGMAPNKIMACHIHQYGDTSKGCISLGPHWNPYNKEHGSICIDINNSHAGDLINNIWSNSRGKFRYYYTDSRVQLRGDVTESIFGRSVVIHDGIDDLGQGGDTESKKTGNAGGRMACSIIGHAK